MMLREKALYWWKQRASRERFVLATGGLLLFLVFAWLTIEPVFQQRERLESGIPQMREDLAWMQAQLAVVEKLRGKSGPDNSGKAVLTIALVEELLREAGMHDQVSELRPASGQDVMLRFKQVAYPQLMEFLLQLRQRAAARISMANFSRLQDHPGMVEASLSLSPDPQR